MKHHKGGVGRRRRRDTICKPHCLASDEDRYYLNTRKGEGGGGEGGMPYVNPTAWHLMRTVIISRTAKGGGGGGEGGMPYVNLTAWHLMRKGII